MTSTVSANALCQDEIENSSIDDSINASTLDVSSEHVIYSKCFHGSVVVHYIVSSVRQ